MAIRSNFIGPIVLSQMAQRSTGKHVEGEHMCIVFNSILLFQ